MSHLRQALSAEKLTEKSQGPLAEASTSLLQGPHPDSRLPELAQRNNTPAKEGLTVKSNRTKQKIANMEPNIKSD